MEAQSLSLQYNRPVRIAGTVTLECVAGHVWLTRTGGAGDIFLHPGERYVLDWPDMVLAESVSRHAGEARLLLHMPVPLWRCLVSCAKLVLSSVHGRLRAMRKVRRDHPLAG